MAARVPYVTRNDLPEADSEIFDQFIKERGAEPGHIHRVVANAPNLLRRFLGLANELRNGTQLDPKLRELALMTVGRLDQRRVRIHASLEHLAEGRHQARTVRTTRRASRPRRCSTIMNAP